MVGEPEPEPGPEPEPSPDLCAPISNVATPVLSTSFDDQALGNIQIEDDDVVLIVGGDENLIIKSDHEMIGPCAGAWRFTQSPANGGYIQADGLLADAVTLRAVVELPELFPTTNIRDQAIATKSGVSTGSVGAYELFVNQTPTEEHPRLVAQIRSGSQFYMMCSEEISDADVIDIRLHMGLGDNAQLFYRPWLEDSEEWGPFVEAASDARLVVFGATRTCGLVNGISILTQTSNTKPLTVGHTNHASNDGNRNYLGWIAQFEYYAERLVEPVVEND